MVLAAYTLMDWLTRGAAAYVVLPGSLKLTTHVPCELKVTLPGASVQPLEEASSVITTTSPDVAFALGE
jgi:hypothetical protein